MSFTPNQAGILLRKLERRDIHGREFFAHGEPLALSVVRLSEMVEETSVRADSSASRGAGDMEILQAKLLVGPMVKIKKGDVVKFRGILIEIESVHERFDVFGKPHHLELGGNIKGDM